MSLPDQHWETWADTATSWWLDGENEEAVIVNPGDECLFEKTPSGAFILREVRPRGRLQ
ncbi:hypothetical protein [Brevundimonas diminuta]|uniref:hypothetical protein n=1 Tax=Brevundimonas diminuta TaxID=293 RepID=UPI003F80D015